MTMTSVEQLRSLADVDREDAALVGNKAATLATLRRAGFPVPDGVVLTTEALEHALTAAGLADGAPQSEVEAMPLPSGLEEALAAAVRRLGSDRLAVRSSGVEEDLPDASYAGQYETVLNVPAKELGTAVRRCWASAFSDRVTCLSPRPWKRETGWPGRAHPAHGPGRRGGRCLQRGSCHR